MPENYANLLNPAQARIFRIIHHANLPWVLENGLHCGNSPTRAVNWVSIGNQDLIATRARWPVKVPPGGVLNDYLPFYFTPFSVMMHNINTGWSGVTQPRSRLHPFCCACRGGPCWYHPTISLPSVQRVTSHGSGLPMVRVCSFTARWGISKASPQARRSCGSTAL